MKPLLLSPTQIKGSTVHFSTAHPLLLLLLQRPKSLLSTENGFFYFLIRAVQEVEKQFACLLACNVWIS